MKIVTAAVTATLVLSSTIAPTLSGPRDAQKVGVQWFEGSFEQALSQARSEDRLVVLDCWAIWCQFCREMDERVWSRLDLAASLRADVIPFKAEVDVNRNAGLELKSRYGIDSLPMVLIVEPNSGDALAKLDGFVSAEALVAAIEKARSARAESASSDGDRQRDPHVALQSAGRASVKKQTDEAIAAARKAIELDEACAEDVADDAALLLANIHAERDEHQVAVDLLEKTTPVCEKADKAFLLWSAWADAAGAAGDEMQRGKLLARRVEAYPDDHEALYEYVEARVNSIHVSEPDPAMLKIADFAQLESRLGELETRLADDPRPLALQATFYEKLGDIERAVEIIESAIELDPHDPDLRERRLSLMLALRRQ